MTRGWGLTIGCQVIGAPCLGCSDLRFGSNPRADNGEPLRGQRPACSDPRSGSSLRVYTRALHAVSHGLGLTCRGGPGEEGSDLKSTLSPAALTLS